MIPSIALLNGIFFTILHFIFYSHPKNWLLLIPSFLHYLYIIHIQRILKWLLFLPFFTYFLPYFTFDLWFIWFILFMVLLFPSLLNYISLFYIHNGINFSIPHSFSHLYPTEYPYLFLYSTFSLSFTSKEDFIIFIIYYFCWHWMWTNQHSQISFTICTYPNVHVYISLWFPLNEMLSFCRVRSKAFVNYNLKKINI